MNGLGLSEIAAGRFRQLRFCGDTAWYLPSWRDHVLPAVSFGHDGPTTAPASSGAVR